MLTKQLLFLLLCLQSLSLAANQTCSSQLAEDTPDSRFTDGNDGTVIDTQTQLMWKHCGEGMVWSGSDCTGSGVAYSWQEALERADSVNNSGGFAGYTDWRVPNIKELHSIAEFQCYVAANLTIFPDTDDYEYYWSSSWYIGSEGDAWMVDFSDGRLDNFPKDDTSVYLRLVRNGS